MSIYDLTSSGPDAFDSNGFALLKSVFYTRDLTALQNHICSFSRTYFTQYPSYSGSDSLERLTHLLESAAENTPAELQNFLEAVGSLSSYLSLVVGDKIKDTLNVLAPRSALSVKGGLFLNCSSAKQYTYGWHQESPYFKSNEFALTLWSPVIRDINVTGGEMLVVKGSHLLGAREFIESRVDGGYLQKTVSLKEAEYNNIISCDLNLGDAVIFHPDLVHCTNPILKSDSRITSVTRFVKSL